MYILQLLDWYAASITVILVCLCEVIIVGWIYGIDNFIRDIEFMIGNPVGLWWRISWKYISPAILTVNWFSWWAGNSIIKLNCNHFRPQFIFITAILFNTDITYNGMSYPKWLTALGWASCLISIACIPIYFVYKLLKMNGSLKKVWRKKFTKKIKSFH